MPISIVTRADAGSLLRHEVREDGSVLADGVLARPGIMLYRMRDGSTLRELVPPEVLADKDWLVTVGRAPVTLEHPAEMVTPDNISQYLVGDTDGDVEVDDRGFVRIKVALRTQSAIDSFMSARTRGLSPGYTVSVDPTPGVDPVFGAYDSRQVKRHVTNHNALCASPRGGDACSLRFDAYEVEPMAPIDPKILTLIRTAARRDSMEEGEAPSVLEGLINELLRARSDMADFAKMKGEHAAMKTELDAARADLCGAQAKLDEFMAKEKAAGEAAMQADALAVAQRLKVTVTAADAAGVQREVVKAIFATDADDTTLPGLWVAAKAHQSATERLRVADAPAPVAGTPFKSPYPVRY
jgi:hypothetical protein